MVGPHRIFVLNGIWSLSMKFSTRNGSLSMCIRKYTPWRGLKYFPPTKAPQTASEQKWPSLQHFQERAILSVQKGRKLIFKYSSYQKAYSDWSGCRWQVIPVAQEEDKPHTTESPTRHEPTVQPDLEREWKDALTSVFSVAASHFHFWQ